MSPLALLCFLFILPTHSFAFIFEIESSTKELNFLQEESLEVECAFNPKHTGVDVELSTVEEIHIIRKEDDSHRWKELAKLQANGYLRKTSADIQVSGSVGPKVNDTFLKLYWEVASKEELGIYRCDVVAMDVNYEFDIQESNMMTIFEHNVTTEELVHISQRHINSLQLEFDKFKKKTANKLAQLEVTVKELKNESMSRDDTSGDVSQDIDVDQLKEDIRESVLANVSTLVGEMSCSRLFSCFDLFTAPPPDPVTTKQIEIDTTTPSATTAMPTTIAKLTTIGPEMPWPTGRFALLKSNSGCPVTPTSSNWAGGYVKYHTESVDENHDNITQNSHLAQPAMEVDTFNNHFLYMHFCVSFNVNPYNSPWPAGSYCINRVASQCPTGFLSGYMDIDEEDTNFEGKSRGVLPDMLFFCCRGDGSPFEEISLPSSKPFYLYRFGGQCQAVNGMQVTPERMLFDTENDNNQDDYENDIHPDGKLKDVEMELCYYS